MNKHANCLICSKDKLIPLLDYYEKHKLIKCTECGFVFMENIPSTKELDSYYNSYSYSTEGYLSQITIKSYNLLLDEFEKYRSLNKLLDIGCGRGWFLVEAQKRGWEVFGTEYSHTALKICKNNGIQTKEGGLDKNMFNYNMFDIVTSFEVIEHINTPQNEIKIVSNLLRKGGFFYCTTPNFNSILRYYLKEKYNLIEYPEHLAYYTKTTLNKLIKKHGFKQEKFLSTGISITRLNTSIDKKSEKLISKESSDEILRQKLEKKWYLLLIKKFANTLLTWANLGMTLKGYYIKQ